jgi:hypothetical protein
MKRVIGIGMAAGSRDKGERKHQTYRNLEASGKGSGAGYFQATIKEVSI